MAGLQLGGLASGMDTETIIGQLMAAERAPRARSDQQSQVVEARKSALGDIQGKLRALQTATQALRSPTLFAPTQTVETSDASRVAVTRTGGVGTGAYMVKVDQVAAAEQRSYRYDKQAAASKITVDGHDVEIPAGAELADVLAKINGDADGKVWASDVGGRIAFSWRATGGDANDDVVTGDALSDPKLLRAGHNAKLYVDGVLKEPSTNTFTEIPGLSLTLKAPTTTDVAVTVGPPGPDVTAVQTKLQAFVDAYNSANELMRTELNEEKVKDPQNKVDRGKGVLRGDAGISALQSRLRQVLSETFGTGSSAADQLADLGVSTGATTGSSSFSKDAVNGKLTLDPAKLAATLAAEPTRAEQLLGGAGGKGIAQRIEALLDPATKLDGTFDTRTKSADAELKRLKDQMSAFDARLDAKERAYRAMFTRMESALAQSSSQGSWLSSQLSALG